MCCNRYTNLLQKMQCNCYTVCNMSAKHQKKCIDIKNVSFSYGKINVLDNISLNIDSGDYVGIVGPNGGGKSTLLKLIVGLLLPQKGTIRIFGHSVSEAKDHLDIGYVPQRAGQENQFPATVEEIVESGRINHIGIFKRISKDDTKAVQEAMELANITDLRERMISELSGGQRQRVYIARSLTKNPKILILDEPTEGIDMTSKQKFYQILENLNKKLGITIIIVSHEIDMIAKQVKNVICLNNTLVCQTDSRDFIKGTYLEKLYGKNGKVIVHKHIE